MKFTYQTTITSCFIAYIVQAVVGNYAPLLFVTFQTQFDISLGQITILIACNFITQLIVDLVSMSFVDRIGYRASIMLGDGFAATGLILLPILPQVMNPLAGLCLAVICYAIGGGLIEVLVSPIVQSCPTENKEKAMSMLLSFYSWGVVIVIFLSTVFFNLIGVEYWWLLTFLWALLPIANGLVFMRCPFAPLIPQDKKGMSLAALLRTGVFWIFILMMVCAGAAELSIGQWASAFAEEGLGLTKTLGDLAGPMAFAALMGLTRVFYGRFGDRINLNTFMICSTALCLVSYLMIGLVPVPIVSLVGCGLCGIAVGIMWPGPISEAAERLPLGGTYLFAMLAVGGDIGCSVGPGVVGLFAELAGDQLKIGMLVAIVFPIILILCLIFRTSFHRRHKDASSNADES